MLRLAGLALVGVSLAVMIAPPAWADTLPAKRTAASGDAQRVADRLSAVGVPAAEARAHAASLPSADAAYFAGAGERVQVVAGVDLAEMISGTVLLALVGASAWVLLDDTKK